MSLLDQLERAVREAIRTGRVGRPVFVRCTADADADRPGLRGVLVRILSAARGWVEDELDRLYVQESSDGLHCAATALFRGGATALVAACSGAAASPGIDLIVLGNHGALYHEGFAGSIGVGAADAAGSGDDAVLRRAVETSVASGRPVSLGGEGSP